MSLIRTNPYLGEEVQPIPSMYGNYPTDLNLGTLPQEIQYNIFRNLLPPSEIQEENQILSRQFARQYGGINSILNSTVNDVVYRSEEGTSRLVGTPTITYLENSYGIRTTGQLPGDDTHPDNCSPQNSIEECLGFINTTGRRPYIMEKFEPGSGTRNKNFLYYLGWKCPCLTVVYPLFDGDSLNAIVTYIREGGFRNIDLFNNMVNFYSNPFTDSEVEQITKIAAEISPINTLYRPEPMEVASELSRNPDIPRGYFLTGASLDRFIPGIVNSRPSLMVELNGSEPGNWSKPSGNYYFY